MDPQSQPQFNPKIPISELLKQEQTGYTPSAPKEIPLPPYSPLSPSHSVPLSGIINTAQNPDSTGQPVQHEKIVKTFRSDTAEALRLQHSSVAKIVVAEDSRRRERNEDTAPVAKKRFGSVLAIVILIILGAASIPAVQYVLNLKTKPVAVIGTYSLVPFDNQQTLTLKTTDRDSLISTLDDFNAKIQSNSAVERANILETVTDTNNKISTKQLPASTFANLIGPGMPSALARSFDSDYMYGKEGTANPQPFILFKTFAYDLTFANMLHWETKMITDLTPILNLPSTTAGQSFKDRVVGNKDVRAVAAADGTILFLYGFLDNQTLIITTNAQTFQNINTRFIAQHFVQ